MRCTHVAQRVLHVFDPVHPNPNIYAFVNAGVEAANVNSWTQVVFETDDAQFVILVQIWKQKGRLRSLLDLMLVVD